MPSQQSQPSRDSIETSNDEPQSKRRRISLACTACRARKSRCDGARPKCSSCEELNFACVYKQSASTSNIIVGKEYLTSLEDRLKAVEESLTAVRAQQARSQRQIRFDDEDTELTNQPSVVLGTASLSQRDNGVDLYDDDGQDTPDIIDETDGMGAVTFSPEEYCGFFGPSSNISFTRHISRAVARLSHISEPTFTPENFEDRGFQISSGVVSMSRTSSPSSRHIVRQSKGGRDMGHVNIYALPPEPEARQLLAQYFSDTGLLFPYLHKETFMKTYDEMLEKSVMKVRRTWLGLLNIVMALATSTALESDLDAEQRSLESDIYYRRSIALCKEQIMRGTSLEVVQYLLVMGQYLQGTQRSVETWMIHGLAVKAALQLGLHSVEASRRFPQQVQEIRKRTWYGCIVLDRTLSMTFGRPAAIPNSYVKLGLPCHIEEGNPQSSPNDATQDSLVALSVKFFNATITLYKIMGDVIDVSYGSNLSCDDSINSFDTVSHLFKMDQQLVEWETSLPTSLVLRHAADLSIAVPSSGELSLLLEKCQTILTLRHHNLRILLHRPILVKFLGLIGKGNFDVDPQEINFLQQLGGNSVRICVQSSMDIIAIIHNIVTSPHSRRMWLGAWWFTLYYAFNAAMVICAALLLSHERTFSSNLLLPVSLPTTDLQKTLRDAAVALQSLDVGNSIVERCARYLEQLSGVLGKLMVTTATNDGGRGENNLPELSLHQAEGNKPHNIPSQGYSSGTASNLTPLGMDLGEFMLEGDLEFMNQLAGMGHFIPMERNMGSLGSLNH
ncbi:fungal-specific transcription factor domain-containing protein [Rhexocercosporidium sp. MPI-PUGE-AT-0058]|nr:fungal-specific transcription factor domain-containing protein [Rhexocercosporidium sp. MPI-PUGE-AT-0058]